jgi:Cellulase (glycosyl hydrolase family 5)
MQKQFLFPSAALVALVSVDCAVGGGPQNSESALGIDAGAPAAVSSSSGGSSSGGVLIGSNGNPSEGASTDDASINGGGGDDGAPFVVSGDDGSGSGGDDGSAPGADSGGVSLATSRVRDAGVRPDAGTASSSSGSSSGGTSSSGGAATTLPAGWLYTSANKIYVSNGSSGGTQWIGRGVNVDDIFLCGYDNTLWMSSAGQTLQSITAGLVKNWKPSFVRVSLGMNSYPTAVTWTDDTNQYATQMTSVIKSIGANPNVYVLVTLRSDPSMIGEDTVDQDPEATGLPSDSTTTPDSNAYPTGTDATYIALVDAFANSKFVLFGLTNEPGGNKLTNSQISAAMNHAVGTIRAEEDRLGVPHHIVSVQGNGWSSDLSFYTSKPAPITYDNVVYELHYYPGNGSESASSYQYSSTLPMIIGEYGSFTSSVTQSGFYADMEAKGIPNLAWDFEPYSDCAPDLLSVTTSTTLTPTTWGSSVQSYLLSH